MSKVFLSILLISVGAWIGLNVTPAALSANRIMKSGAKASANVKPVAPPCSPFINGHYVLGAVIRMNGYHSNAPTVVVVDKGSHSTYVLQLQNEGQKSDVFRVLTVSNAIGSVDKPTPAGRYLILSKKLDPIWLPPVSIDKHQKPVPPYNQTHKNPLGVAAIYLNKDQLALHGTNDPRVIRKSASHGCIRHSNADIMRLYSMVKVGTPVYIVREFRGTVLNQNDFKKSSRAGKNSEKAP